MKKKTALVLTLAVVFSLAPLSAYADTIDRVGGTASHDVTATYVDGSSGGAGGAGGKVYSVDITWGGINLLEGYGQDNPGSKSQGVKQLVAGGGVALIGVTLVPLLSGLLG